MLGIITSEKTISNHKQLEVYLVGGAVRDTLLGLGMHERDWVVVGSTPAQMQSLGYKAVGKDFPVFLHPKTKEEYALARTERKVAKGYKGFEIYADPSVTLEQDLMRRDLTINAIAQTSDGALIDPFGGVQDLQNKVLRHISLAFAEDPLRILRVARFAAKLPQFKIDPKTMQFMCDMVNANEVSALTSERVLKEFLRAINLSAATKFFETLKDCGAKQVLFPMLSDIHPELLKSNNSSEENFALLMYALSETQLQQFLKTYVTPKQHKALAQLLLRFHDEYKRAQKLDAQKLLTLFLKTDALRREARFKHWLHCCERIYNDNTNSNYLLERLAQLKNVDHQALIKQGLSGEAFAKALKKLQLKQLADGIQ